MNITIRREQETDFQAIREVTTQAFASSDLGHHGEADVIERIRANCPETLSLVALRDERLVGHILFSPVVIEGDADPLEGMGLAPMSVLPDDQHVGIGSQLVERGLRLLTDRQCPFAVVLGHPDFYARFGFEPARQFGITCEFAGIPDEVFRIKLLKANSADFPNGVAKYRSEFSAWE